MDDTSVRDTPPPPPPPPPPQAPRRLFRRPEPEAKIGGVCAGVADHLGIDVTLVRIAFVVLAFSGPGFPAYVLLWVVIPKAPDGTPANPVRHGPVLGGGTNPVLGVALVFAALLFVFDDGFFGRDGVLLPALLVGAGIWLLVRDRDESSPPATPAPPAWPAPPLTPVAPVAPVPQADDGTTTGDTTTVATTPAAAVPTWQGATPPPLPPPPWWAEPVAPPPPPPPAEPPSALGRTVLGGLVIAVAGLLALSASDAVDPDVGDVLAVAVLAVGAGLLVGARWGRARWLVVPGLVLVVALTAVGFVDVPLTGGVGERRYVPLVATDLDRPYRLAAGEMEIDLRSFDLTSGRAVVTASVGAGELRVLVPDGATIVLDADVGAGHLSHPGDEQDARTSSGPGSSAATTIRGAEGAGTVELDLRVGVGEVAVRRG